MGSEREEFLAFRKKWDLDIVKNMTLEEYTSTKADEDGDRDDFTYWLESKTDKLGSMWGGSAFKFGVYKRGSNEQKQDNKGRMYDDGYAWHEKYGKDKDEAFNRVRNLIVKIIESSQSNNLKAIDDIELGDVFKWKIAFMYQDPDNIKIVNIFSKEILQK